MSRVAVVTGAAAGMGLAVAPAPRRRRKPRRAARPRRRTVSASRGRAPRDGCAARCGLVVDVSDRAAVDEAMAKVRSDLGPVEIMVTSAGFDEFRSFTDITAEAWARMLAVNLTGTFHCVQAAIPDMIAAGWGRIVTISSSSAQSGAARHGALRRVEGRRHRAHQGVGRRVRAARHHREHDPARIHRHADGPPGRGARRPPVDRRGRGPHARCAGPAHRRTSRPRPRSSAPTRRATSPAS